MRSHCWRRSRSSRFDCSRRAHRRCACPICGPLHRPQASPGSCASRPDLVLHCRAGCRCRASGSGGRLSTLVCNRAEPLDCSPRRKQYAPPACCHRQATRAVSHRQARAHWRRTRPCCRPPAGASVSPPGQKAGTDSPPKQPALRPGMWRAGRCGGCSPQAGFRSGGRRQPDQIPRPRNKSAMSAHLSAASAGRKAHDPGSPTAG